MVYRLKRIRFETWLKWGLGGLVLAAILIVLPYGALRRALTFEHIMAWVRSSQSNGWTMMGFFSIFSLATLGFPVTVFPIVGGVLFPFWIAFPLNMAAETAGALLAFGIARFFGREAVETFLRGRMKAFDRFTSHEGIKAVLVVRFSGFPPFVIANYVLGLSGVTIREYVLGTVIGITPWTALMTGLSGFFWQAAVEGGEKGLIKTVTRTMAPLTAVSLLVLSGIALNAYLRRKKIVSEPESSASHSNL